MSTIIGTQTVGLEEIQRAALLQLFDHLNPTLVELQASWATKDQAFATRLGRPYVPTSVEPVGPNNFVDGHRPSLINGTLEQYPNCAVWAVRAIPHPESASLDHAEIYTDALYIEIMVKATDEEGEEVVNRRVQRTAEAVQIVLGKDPTLGGIVSGFTTAPTIEISDVFTKKDRGETPGRGTRTSYGPHWLWQGARLEYAVRKEMGLHPSPDTGSFFRTAGLNIDQM